MTAASNTISMPTRMQRTKGWFLRNLLLPWGDRLFGQAMVERLRFLEKAQWWNAERLHEERDRLLGSVVQTAYRDVPFYRSLWDSNGVDLKQIRTAGDLRRLPVVTKDMLRQSPAHDKVRRTGFRTYEVSTSGSRGTNFRLLEDTFTAGWHRASRLLAFQWAGWTIGEPHAQMGMTLNRSLDRKFKDRFLGCHYMSAYDLSDDSLDRTLDRLETHAIKHLWGYPGSIYYLARRAEATGWNLPLSSMITWGDNLYPHYREVIERVFRRRVNDTYGCAEGIQIAAQCGNGDNYHVHTLDTIVEYVDEDGEPVKRGEPGNLLLTRLHLGPTPLIRYRVGDVGAAASAEHCECGRGFDLMRSIQGRDTDVVLTPSGNRLIVHFFTGILEHLPEIDSFQVVQERPGEMNVLILPAANYASETTAQIVASLRDHGAADMDIHVELVPEIGLTSAGKRRFIVNRMINK
jgi:phenylacetate-CoA ligase